VAFRGAVGGHPLEGRVILETDFESSKLFRWEQPINYHVSGSNDPQLQAEVSTQMARMASLAGITAKRVDDASAANFKIEFFDRKGILINGRSFVPCVASTRRADEKISLVRIRISTQIGDRIDECIVHELFHGFGFAHTNTLPSVVNYATPIDYMTKWDELALRVMYSSQLKSGMERHEALPIARKIILSDFGNVQQAN